MDSRNHLQKKKEPRIIPVNIGESLRIRVMSYRNQYDNAKERRKDPIGVLYIDNVTVFKAQYLFM